MDPASEVSLKRFASSSNREGLSGGNSGIICLVFVSVLIAYSAFIYCSEKAGLSLDEIYSYGLSNSYYEPFLKSVADGDLIGKVMTKEQMNSYIMVDRSGWDSFAYDSVYYNQTQDVHPPLFYFALHTVSSFFPGIYSKWMGLAVNLIFFAATLFLVYALSNFLFGNRLLSAVAVALYGLSPIGLSTVLLIRMYMLLTFLTVALALLVAKMLVAPKRWHYPLLSFLILTGLMTQYFFVFYTFILSAFYVLYCLWKKRWKDVLTFSIFAFGGVGLFVLAWPACFTHLFGSDIVSGSTVASNATDPMSMLYRVKSLLKEMIAQAPAVMAVGMLAFVSVLVGALTQKAKTKERLPGLNVAVLVLLPALIACIAIAITSPYDSPRYIYHLVPLLSTTAVVFLFAALEAFERKASEKTSSPAPTTPPMSKKITHSDSFQNSICLLVILTSFASTLSIAPSWLNLECARSKEAISPFKDSPCIYVTDNVNPPATLNLFELAHFDDVLFIDEATAASTTIDYLKRHGQKDDVIVFIASYPDAKDENAVLDEMHVVSGKKDHEELYRGDISAAYRLYGGTTA
ncbi:glycosyltransferase family 39 protein [Gordonibacter massiliensis (ex Traore et al. 2017)]|uniref:glycosyltransferase family 39 protein n=1 Tax=Gordonibacter massiliensis (ex Traore et al. 2017) TaxID=1841863 RepID=UPI001C8B2868|nr:glycosyltransferase family 39 protein [Gordonibacter massiliensis (ex Traore et al. 2017)]MBX9033643.1 hypothetical protein [Gordonibacter massiliensis (ex Traore et al. 2017)]